MRNEEYLQGILGALGVGEDKGVPDPVWRHEEYLKAIYDKLKEGGGSLPPVTEADNGKVMAVIDGEWEPSLIPIDDEKIEQFVDAWLDDHPEATTTVQDGAITRAKLAAALAASFAEDYSSEKTYPVIGTYVWHSGALYKNIVSITTAEAWTAAHWTAVALGNDVSDLKSALSNFQTELMQPDFVDITSDLTTVGNGYYQSPIESGITSWHADSSTVTYSLPVKAGETYKITGYNYYQCYLYFARNPLAIPSVYKVFPDTTSTAILYTDIFTVEHDGTLYFGTQVSKIGVFSVKKQVYVRKDFALTDTISSTNLFDPATAVDGYYMGTSGNPSANSNSYYAYIPVQAGTYSFYVYKGLFGANADKIPLFSSNKTYMQQATAVLDTGDTRRTPATLTITQAMYDGGVRYVGWSGFLAYKHLNMFMVGDSYPSNFVPFFDAYSGIEGGIDYAQTLEDNAMFGKMVLFDGDSICNGSSANDGSSGWASRIGDANSMGWGNFGVGGATITYGISGVSHYLSTYIDTIHTYYPKLDYLILEGGTNDADHILTDASKIGTLDMTDFSGTYDNTTFCGALDTLFYKAITYYPAAKIGFIVAPKMASSDVTPIKDYGDNNNRYKFFKIAMTACEKWGIPYLNLWDGSHLNPSLSVMYDGTKNAQENRDAGSMYIDGQHLTAKGYNYISPIIEDWMRSL